jgi:hypothetical protein
MMDLFFIVGCYGFFCDANFSGVTARLANIARVNIFLHFSGQEAQYPCGFSTIFA